MDDSPLWTVLRARRRGLRGLASCGSGVIGMRSPAMLAQLASNGGRSPHVCCLQSALGGRLTGGLSIFYNMKTYFQYS